MSYKEMVNKIKKQKSRKVEVVIQDVEEVEPDAFKSLSDKDKEFCREYIYDWNGRRAAQKVFGYKNEITAGNKASDILRRKRIHMYCDYLNENTEQIVGVSRAWVLEQHLKLVRSSIAHLHDSWITLRDFSELTEDQKFCIEEIVTQTRRETAEGENEDEEIHIDVDYVKIKLYNKQKSLDAITRMMGYDKAQRIDLTSGGEKIGLGTTVNVQVNIYNSGPPLSTSEKEIK